MNTSGPAKAVPLLQNRNLRHRTMATEQNASSTTTGKVRAHQTQNERLTFEKSAPGKKAYKLPPLDVPSVDAENLLGQSFRTSDGLLPELSEIEIIRHFTRLSTW